MCAKMFLCICVGIICLLLQKTHSREGMKPRVNEKVSHNFKQHTVEAFETIFVIQLCISKCRSESKL